MKAQNSGKKLSSLQKTAGFGPGAETGALKGKSSNSGYDITAGPGVASPSSGQAHKAMVATASRKNSLTSIKSAAKQVLLANKLANNFTGRQSNASSKQCFEGGAPEMRAVGAL